MCASIFPASVSLLTQAMPLQVTDQEHRGLETPRARILVTDAVTYSSRMFYVWMSAPRFQYVVLIVANKLAGEEAIPEKRAAVPWQVLVTSISEVASTMAVLCGVPGGHRTRLRVGVYQRAVVD